jgi:S-adenosylmethionine synthetase
MNINVAPLLAPIVGALPLEIAERKGLGHPDTICDALAENLSVALSRHYLERFGAVMHHNVDKGLLWAGTSRPRFGGGEVHEPIEIYLTGRATAEFRGIQVPVEAIAIEASREWLTRNIPSLDAQRHVRIVPRIRPTSPDLAALFLRQSEAGAALANDTSFGVGFAPFSDLEQVVLAVEGRLNGQQVKLAHPEIGADIKVMGSRRGSEIAVTVACALVGRHVADLADYRAKRERVRQLALDAAMGVSPSAIDVQVNTGDGDTADSVYITVSGLSAESGDDGQVGRGNRVNGLITPYRPMSLEAAAGKNPVTHVGKLYNVIANRVARSVVAQVPGVEESHCFLLSRIGQPVDEPQVFDVKARLTEPAALPSLTASITEVARIELSGMRSLWREAVDGGLQVW